MNVITPPHPPEPELQTTAAPDWAAVFRNWPRSLQWSWICVAFVVGMFGYALGRYWLDGFDTTDRVLVVMLAFWCWWRMKATLAQIPTKPLPSLGIPLLALGYLMLFPTWFAYFQIGARPVMMWLFYTTALLTIAGMTLVQFGWRTLVAIRFPLFVLMLALPIPGRINVPIQGFLQNATTSFAFHALQLSGFEAVREGFVIRMPHGDLGVVEACSGIKAFSTFLAVASFAAHFFGFGILRGIVAILISIPIVILTNGTRVYELGVISEWFGQAATQGWKHEVLGGIPVLVGLAVLLLILKLFSNGTRKWASTRPLDASPSLPLGSFARSLTVVIATIGVGAGIYGISIPSIARPAIPDGNAPLDAISMKIGDWQGRDLPINADVMQELSSNKAIFRSYTNRLGYEYYVWVIYWPTAKSVKGYHHPDVCMPSRGNELLMKEEIQSLTKGGRSIPLTYREFGKGTDRQLVTYWTQEGREFWTPEDEANAFHMSFPFRWIQKRMGSRPADATDDRLVVLIATKVWGTSQIPRESMLKFTGQFADELYRICPWADPGTH